MIYSGDPCTGMCGDMCADMCIDICVQTCAQSDPPYELKRRKGPPCELKGRDTHQSCELLALPARTNYFKWLSDVSDNFLQQFRSAGEPRSGEPRSRS